MDFLSSMSPSIFPVSNPSNPAPFKPQPSFNSSINASGWLPNVSPSHKGIPNDSGNLVPQIANAVGKCNGTGLDSVQCMFNNMVGSITGGLSSVGNSISDSISNTVGNTVGAIGSSISGWAKNFLLIIFGFILVVMSLRSSTRNSLINNVSSALPEEKPPEKTSRKPVKKRIKRLTGADLEEHREKEVQKAHKQRERINTMRKERRGERGKK